MIKIYLRHFILKPSNSFYILKICKINFFSFYSLLFVFVIFTNIAQDQNEALWNKLVTGTGIF